MPTWWRRGCREPVIYTEEVRVVDVRDQPNVICVDVYPACSSPVKSKVNQFFLRYQDSRVSYYINGDEDKVFPVD